jgi:hypothetical protein
MNLLRPLWNTAEQVVIVTDVVQKQLRIIAADMIRGAIDSPKETPAPETTAPANNPWISADFSHILPNLALVPLTPANTNFSTVTEGPSLELTPAADLPANEVITLQS